MKRVTASEVRRRWFEILDRVAAGEAVVIERKGRRIVIRREDSPATEPPDYGDVLRVVGGSDDADRWSWDWEDDGLHPVTRPA